MGKPSKRKNPGVGVDFRKVKHKVGKKLPKAQNDTNTDFKSRSINLPTQSLAQDKAGAAVSERNLTLKVRFALLLSLKMLLFSYHTTVQS
jgi:pre-rRNA-processing protein IPI1